MNFCISFFFVMTNSPCLRLSLHLTTSSPHHLRSSHQLTISPPLHLFICTPLHLSTSILLVPCFASCNPIYNKVKASFLIFDRIKNKKNAEKARKSYRKVWRNKNIFIPLHPQSRDELNDSVITSNAVRKFG